MILKNLLNEKKIQLTSVASTVIPLQTAIALYRLLSCCYGFITRNAFVGHS